MSQNGMYRFAPQENRCTAERRQVMFSCISAGLFNSGRYRIRTYDLNDVNVAL